MVTARITLATDPQAWDAEVQRLGGRLLQSWRWGEFKRRHGWRPFRFFIETAEVSAAAQVLVRSLGGLSVLYVPRGPLCERPTHDLAEGFCRAVEALARDSHAITILAEPEDDRGSALLPPELGWKPSRAVIQPLRTLRVPLGEDDDMLRNMKPKTRYNLRLAFRRGVTTRLGRPDELDAFYALLVETAQRDGFGIHRRQYFADLLSIFDEDAALIFAEYGGELAAAALVVRFGEEAVYLYGASRTTLQRHMPAYAVQWSAMQWAREQGCRWYDLWGIPAEEEPPPEVMGSQRNVRAGLWGVYRFKLGFGGHPYTYPGVRERIRNPFFVALWRRLRPIGA